ncbi:hypothetical protein FACS1894190_15980 [Spirochaetia bacterium]|nr:hypothetical protein FACS1894190_15980 [Spirochaetia bacterium]
MSGLNDAAAPAKREALKNLHKAVSRQCPNITGLEYHAGKDSVLIKFRNGSLWVNTCGDSIIAMLSDVLNKIQKHS